MDRLLRELTSRYVLDTVMVDWARARRGDLSGAADSVLLELDLVAEDDLVDGLEAVRSVTALRPEELGGADAGLAVRVAASDSEALGMCPLRWAGDELRVLVNVPLSAASLQVFSEKVGAKVTQVVGSAFHLALARHRVYGEPLDEGARELDARLTRRRAADVRGTLERLQLSSSLADSARELLALAERLLDFSCFFAVSEGQLGVVASPGAGPAVEPVLPEPGCTLAPAIRHGGYFLGPLQGGDADRRFYESMGRAMPEWAFVAPVPAADATAVFYADNGPRGIAKRWVAELTLLVARVARQTGDWRALAHRPPPPVPDAGSAVPVAIGETPASVELSVPSETATTMIPLTRAEITALYLLRNAAAEAATPVDELAERLLSGEGAAIAAPPPPPAEAAPPVAPDTAALAGEVRGLFDKLATDIPAQLARGMEAAFRELVPRLGGGAPGAQSPAAEPPRSPAAGVELVQKSDAPREVPSYRSRRHKSKRVKL